MTGLAAGPGGRRGPAAPVEIISFGYGHGPAPDADSVFGVRAVRDRHVRPELRQLTARDGEVIEAVLGTPGAARVVRAVADAALGSVLRSPGLAARVAIGCAGGRHRSAVIAAAAARLPNRAGAPVTLIHRDIDRPVIERRAESAS